MTLKNIIGHLYRVDIELNGQIKSVKVSELLFDWGHPNRSS